MRERWTRLVFAHRINDALAACLTRIRTEAIAHLRHRSDVRRVELVHLVDVAEDRVQVLHHAGTLLGGEVEVREVGDVADVFFGDLHSLLLDFLLSAGTNVIRCTTSFPTSRLIPARYCGKKLVSSFCQPRSGTIT